METGQLRKLVIKNAWHAWRSNRCDPEQTLDLFRRILAGFALLLLGVTWKLWTPQLVFPQIPFFSVFVETPRFFDWMGGAIVLICLLGMLIASSRSGVRLSSLMFAVFGTGLVLLDQHRLQPWTYQFLVFAILIATSRTKSALFWMRWIVISIYIFSALSKFDYQFIHTVGDQMLSTLVGFIGVESSKLPEDVRHWLIIAFPSSELAVGIGLAVAKTRRLTVPFAIALHAMLLLTLGPLGLGHQPSVLVWNLFFIAQVVLLFSRLPLSDSTVGDPEPKAAGLDLVGTLVAMTVILFPATRAIGICDHWPAWEVYAPRSSRAEIVSPMLELTSSSRSDPRPDHEPWLDMQRWSLSELGVPIYPDARFQLAVAIAVEKKFDLDRKIQVELKTESNRRTGARKSARLTGRDQLEMRASQYWLNTKARSIWLDN